MTSRLSQYRWLLMILAFAFVTRILTISYGLPYHLYGDEEVNVYGALQMIQLHTLLPALHSAAFDNIFYEPPATAYLYVIAFIPVIAVKYLVLGMPSLAALKNALLLDPSSFFYVARTLTVLFSIGSIVLVYLIAQRFFRSAPIALLSAAFLATSFSDATLSGTARHWTLGIFWSLAALWCVLTALEPGANRRKSLVFGGVLLGLSFATSYLVYIAPFIFLLVLYRSSGGWRITRAFIRDILTLGIPSALVAIISIAVAPHPFFAQVINHVTPAGERSLSAFVSYYGLVFVHYEPVLLIAAIIGAIILVRRERVTALLFGLYFATSLVLMYFFMPNLARYVEPLIPLLAIVAGYGLYQTLRALPKSGGAALLALTGVYFVLVFGRYEVLMLRSDARTAARAWVLHNVPAKSALIIGSDTMRFYASTSSLAVEARIEPERLRASDRSLMAGATVPVGIPVYDVYPLSATSSEKRAALIDAARSAKAPQAYLVLDSWFGTDPLAEHDTLAKTFSAGVEYPTKWLPTGGDLQVDPGVFLLPRLYATEYLGPTVRVYILPKL